jgi:hypothetical protein
MRDFIVTRSKIWSHLILGGGACFTLYLISLYFYRILRIGWESIHPPFIFSVSIPLLLFGFFFWRFFSGWVVAVRSKKNDLLLIASDQIAYRKKETGWKLQSVRFDEIRSISFSQDAESSFMKITRKNGTFELVKIAKEFPSHEVIFSEILRRTGGLSKRSEICLESLD